MTDFPYKLLERMGEGGMGEVWVADQLRPVKRQVALKIIKIGIDTRQAVARFEAERQALAVMDHPNIAKVYDGGVTPEGRPYFAMELARGQPITHYCDRERLSTRERIRLVTAACRAVQHAHQKGVVHRDLKPANLLVTIQDGRPTVKVIDFGIAKALGQSLTDATLHTRVDEVVGTPDYMSPEQADPTSPDVDTRTDVYSLGVVLYELLSGTRPYSLRDIRGWALGTALREKEAPRPSEQLTRSDTQQTVARCRSTTVRHLRRELSGELDWIVLKAMAKDRTQRYETPNALSLDLERYLANEDVRARPPSATYRLRKFVRRHRGVVTASAAVLTALVIGASIAALGWRESVRQARLSRSRELAATALNQIAIDPELSLMLARHAAEIAPTAQAEAALVRTLEFPTPRTLARYPDGIDRVALSPDGSRLVTAGEDAVRLLDTESGTVLLELPTSLQTRPNAVAFSPDGEEFVVSGRFGGQVRTARTGTLRLEFDDGGGKAAGYDRDGNRFVTAGSGAISIRDAETGEPLLELSGGVADEFAVSPDANQIASIGFDRSTRAHLVTVWDAQTGGVKLDFHDTTMHAANRIFLREAARVAFSPDGTRIATAGVGGIQVWDPEDGGLLATMPEWSGGVSRLVFSPDGGRLAGAGLDGYTRVWDARTGWELIGLRSHAGGANDVVFHVDGRRLITAGADGQAKIWDLELGSSVRSLGVEGASLEAISFSPDGNHLAATGAAGRTWIWDASNGAGPREMTSMTRPGDGRGSESGGWVGIFRSSDPSALRPARALAFNPMGDRLAVAGLSGDVEVWDVETGALLRRLAHYDPSDPRARTFVDPAVTGVAFSPDGRWIGSTGPSDERSMGSTVKVWDARKGTQIWARSSSGIHDVVFHPDGDDLVLGRGNGVVIVDATDGEERLRLPAPGRPVEVAISPDGEWIAVAGGRDHAATVWTAQTGEAVAVLDGHEAPILGMAFSPDGTRLATGSEDGTAKIWDVRTEAEIVSFRGQGFLASPSPEPVKDLAFSPDASRFAMVVGGTLSLLPHGIESLADVAEARVSRSFSPEECERFLIEPCRSP